MFPHVALLVLTAAAAVAAKPTVSTVRPVDVAMAQGNRTLCPYRVVVDRNNDRVPVKIKMIKCALPPRDVDAAPQLGRCTDHRAGQQHAECVELQDFMLVYYRSLNAEHFESVAVGCTCMFLESGVAYDLLSHVHP